MAKPVFAISIETDTSEPHQLLFHNAPNLLESLEAKKIQVPYQCRDGYCGSCRCKKISGDVVYLKEPMAWINDDEILPCVSIPTSDLTLKLSG
ncbi:MAG: 2Fe-2S ferredoxin-like protein [Pseudomonadales bacterium]|nr:2Fe-2S ferredoxin-like protein [Pseudomonadales bacterium]